MTIYSCEPGWEAMLTCIYEARAGKRGYQNIRLVTEPIEQYTLFDEYIHVDTDIEKATKVMEAVCSGISPVVYRELAYTAMSYESDALDNIYHVMILGFSLGPEVLSMVQYRDVMRNQEIRKRLGNEAHHFREFLRFHRIRDVFVAHIEPKSRIISVLGAQFTDRMPSEHWMIVDDVHKEAVVHPVNGEYYLRKLSEMEYGRLLETEKNNDEYTDLWKVFYESIAIKERTNEKCRDNLFPKWVRKHAVEFM